MYKALCAQQSKSLTDNNCYSIHTGEGAKSGSETETPSLKPQPRTQLKA